MPSSFRKGRDLLGPSGFPWQTNLLQIAHVSRWYWVCEQLLQGNLVTTAQLAWCRDPSLPATIPLLSLFRLSQEFPIISGGQNTFAFIGEGVHPTSSRIPKDRWSSQKMGSFYTYSSPAESRRGPGHSTSMTFLETVPLEPYVYSLHRIHLALLSPPAMPLPRIFRSAAPDDWVSPLITVARSLVPVANSVPFPYVTIALTAGLALLELIQMVGKSSEDLKYLAESVTTIMKLLREEMDSHPKAEDTRFWQLCLEFETHLTQLSTDLRSIAKNWSASKFKRYLNSHDIRDRIARFVREINDLRANATLVAATGTRLSLEGVAHSVAAVELGVSDIRRGMMEQGSSLLIKTTSDMLGRELARYEEDFHPLKLGDIHLEFGTARPASFVEWDMMGNEKRHTAWVDYKATVKGSVQTVRVYQGSDPLESWKGFLSFLAENSPSPHLPQLFGFCSSPRLTSLVFHGEFCPLDEYAKRLPSAKMIVDWELN
ncbi:hypothetical protein C8F04DRAFT_1233167, partial [Mycena alexandri]